MLYDFNENYGYNFSNPNYISTSTIVYFAGLFGAIVAILLFFTFLHKDNEDKYKGATQKIYNFFRFNRFYAEDMLKLLYIIVAFVLTVVGIVELVVGHVVIGLVMVVIGNIVARISYELMLMFIIMCKKTVSIDKRLSDIENFYVDDEDDYDCYDYCDDNCDNCEICEDEHEYRPTEINKYKAETDERYGQYYREQRFEQEKEPETVIEIAEAEQKAETVTSNEDDML